jgi:hypothetical protein
MFTNEYIGMIADDIHIARPMKDTQSITITIKSNAYISLVMLYCRNKVRIIFGLTCIGVMVRELNKHPLFLQVK